MSPEQLCTFGDVVMVRWIAMTLDGIDRVDAAIIAARANGPVTYVGLVGNDAAMPSDLVRKRLSDGLDRMSEFTRSISLVLDGTGVKFAAMRSAAAAVFLLKGTRRMKMFNSLDDCLGDRAPDRAQTLIEQARDAGII